MVEKIASMKTINLVQKSNTFKMIIPASVEKKIRYACKEVWSTEWSGTLFYTYEGNFEDGSLVITCKDIFVMDIGTQAYTEFDMNPDVIGYMVEHSELLDCQMGLIHSHNNMSTFFSGTDTATLKEEGKDRNNFVSLIVNNAGSYTAAITRRNVSTKTVEECYSYEFFGEGKKKNCRNYEVSDEVVEWFYLNITKEGDEFDYSEMKTRFEEIRKIKKESNRTKLKAQTSTNSNYTPYSTPKGGYLGGTPAKVTKIEKEVKQPELPFEVDDNDSPYILPYGEVCCDKATLDVLVKDLLTGSITINSNSKIDILEYIKIMPTVYAKRFGGDKEGMKLFTTWAESMVEFLIYFTPDEKLTELGFDEDDISCIIAHDMAAELAKLPENEYIKTLIDVLENYIL